MHLSCDNDLLNAYKKQLECKELFGYALCIGLGYYLLPFFVNAVTCNCYFGM